MSMFFSTVTVPTADLPKISPCIVRWTQPVPRAVFDDVVAKRARIVVHGYGVDSIELDAFPITQNVLLLACPFDRADVDVSNPGELRVSIKDDTHTPTYVGDNAWSTPTVSMQLNDQHGNAMIAAPDALHVVRNGQYIRELHGWARFTNTAGGKALGVDFYVTQRSDSPVVEVVTVVTNGVRGDNDCFVASIAAPRMSVGGIGLTLVQEVDDLTPVWTGQDAVPIQSSFEGRWMFVTQDWLNRNEMASRRAIRSMARMGDRARPREGFGFDHTEEFMAHRTKAPTISATLWSQQVSKADQNYQVMSTAIRSGAASWAADLDVPHGGYAPLGFDRSPDAVGGTGIGIDAALLGGHPAQLRLLRLRAACAREGAAIELRVGSDGAVVTASMLCASSGGKRPFDFDLQGLTTGAWGPLSAAALWEQGSCTYMPELKAEVKSSDGQHLVRVFLDAIAFYWLTGDLATAQRLEMIAQWARLAWYEGGQVVDQYYNTGHDLHAKLYGYNTGLSNGSHAISGAVANPGHGGYVGREYAHVATVGAAAAQLSPTLEWLAWCHDMLLLFVTSAQNGTGIPLRIEYPYGANGVPWQAPYAAPKTVAVAASRELPMVAHGAWCLRDAILRNPLATSSDMTLCEQARAAIELLARSVAQNVSLLRLDEYGDGRRGPAIYIGMGTAGGPSLPTVSGYPADVATPGGDPINAPALCTYGYRATGDAQFLVASFAMGVPYAGSSFHDRAAQLLAGSDTGWTQSLAAYMQVAGN